VKTPLRISKAILHLNPISIQPQNNNQPSHKLTQHPPGSLPPPCPQPSASASPSPKCCVRPLSTSPYPHPLTLPLSHHRHLDPPLRSLLPPPHQPHRLPPPHHKNLHGRPPPPPIPIPIPFLPFPHLLRPTRPPLPRHPRAVQFPRNRTPGLHLRPGGGTQRREPQGAELGAGGAVGV